MEAGTAQRRAPVTEQDIGVRGRVQGQQDREGDALAQRPAGRLPLGHGNVADLAGGSQLLLGLVELLDELSYALDQRTALDDRQPVVRAELLPQGVEQLLVTMPRLAISAHDPCSSGTWGHMHLQAHALIVHAKLCRHLQVVEALCTLQHDPYSVGQPLACRVRPLQFLEDLPLRRR